MEKIDQLGQTNVDEIPEGSRFLLEMDYDNLMKSNIHNKTYWVVAMEAAIKAGQRTANRGVRSRTQLKRRQKRSTRERLRVIDVEEEIKSDRRLRGYQKRSSRRLLPQQCCDPNSFQKEVSLQQIQGDNKNK